MSTSAAFALFGAMIILALVPGPGVFAVISRSMVSGFKHGLSTVVGILSADFIFIFLTLGGLTTLAQAMGEFFIVLKFLGAAYLLWLAYSLWRSPIEEADITGIKESSHLSSYIAGLITTLGNPKAIFFYLGFFPAFLNMAAITALDVALILAISTVAIGSVMCGYAFMAAKAKTMLSQPNSRKILNRSAGSIMAGSGIWLAVKS